MEKEIEMMDKNTPLVKLVHAIASKYIHGQARCRIHFQREVRGTETCYNITMENSPDVDNETATKMLEEMVSATTSTTSR